MVTRIKPAFLVPGLALSAGPAGLKERPPISEDDPRKNVATFASLLICFFPFLFALQIFPMDFIPCILIIFGGAVPAIHFHCQFLMED